MRINLIVPYSDKEKAKKLGCRWDSEKECWYVLSPSDIMPYLQWCPKRLKRATTSEPLKHSPFVVVQPRTPLLKKKR